ncbi:MAG: glycosyl transferase family 2 [Gemmatimonadota bacterium]|nr:MAG: glycosyl transferase family 2 [Gemmatimonadota bacterium]
MRVLAIVPAFNEADSVADVVREIRATELADVIVVNDGSTDDTARIAREAGARVLDLPINLGIGGAVQSGYLFAERNGYDVAIQVDGDGQHIAGEIPRLLAPLQSGDADVVLGSRYVEKTSYQSPLARRAGMILFSAVVTVVTGQRLRDTTSGFRAMGRAAIGYLAHHYPQDYPEVEALVLLRRAGFRVTEVACRFRDRTGGTSSITAARSAYYVVKVLLAIFVGLFRSVPPRESVD